MNDQRKTKKQLLEELARERERSIALQEVSKKVAAAHDTDEVLDLIVNEAARLVGAPTAYLHLLDGDVLVLRASTGSRGYQEQFQPTQTVGEGSSVAGYVMSTRKPLFGEDAVDKLNPEMRRFIEADGRDPAAIVSVPLLANDQSIGTLSVRILANTDAASPMTKFHSSLPLPTRQLWPWRKPGC